MADRMQRDRRRSAALIAKRADDLTSRQHGVISRRQALGLGLTRTQIDTRLLTGAWRPGGARGVFVSATATGTPERGLMVACLAGPEGTVASHQSAAALFGFTDHPKTPQVTVPPGTSGRFRGAAVHRSGLDGQDRATVARIPSTGLARTLVDCGAVLSGEALDELVDVAFCRHPAITVARVLEALARASPQGGRKGAAAVRRAIQPWAAGPRAQSPAEMRLFRRIGEWGFPLPERQVEIRDANGRFVARVDCGWPTLRFGLEYEGDEAHTPRAWPADDRRAERIREVDWRIEQVYKEDLWPWSTRLRGLLGEAFPRFSPRRRPPR